MDLYDGKPPDPTVSPVAAEFCKLRDEYRPGLLAACKEAMIRRGLPIDEVEEVFNANEMLQAVEMGLTHTVTIAYLEAEHKRRSEWEQSIERRLQEVRHDAGFDRSPPESVTPVTERNT